MIKILITVAISSGLSTFFVQKLFEHRLNKKLSRFNALFSEKIIVVKRLYQLLIKAEKGLEIFLSIREPKDTEKNIWFRENTIIALNEFRDYFEENEILLDEHIVEIIKKINNHFKEAKKIQLIAQMMEADRGSPEWKKAIENKTKLSLVLSEKEIPSLKSQLKIELQNKFSLLE